MKMYDLKFTAVGSQGPDEHYFSIGSDNGLVLTMQQAIIQTIDD